MVVLNVICVGLSMDIGSAVVPFLDVIVKY